MHGSVFASLTQLHQVFFAVFCLLALIWVYFFIPETMGRTLEQMDYVFGDNQTTSEQARRSRIEQALMQRVDQKVEHQMSEP